jgi:hypothetical protein
MHIVVGCDVFFTAQADRIIFNLFVLLQFLNSHPHRLYNNVLQWIFFRHLIWDSIMYLRFESPFSLIWVSMHRRRIIEISHNTWFDQHFLRQLPTTLSYKTYACKYLHLCPTLLPKFNSTHFKNLRYSICIIANVVQRNLLLEYFYRVVFSHHVIVSGEVNIVIMKFIPVV